MHNDSNSLSVTEVLTDPTCRLDVLYWKRFAVDLNAKSEFSLKQLGQIGTVEMHTVGEEPIQRQKYYTFKITYTGRVELTKLLPNSAKVQSMKVAESGDVVFSRINCCRGAIGIVQDFQDKCICTSETHIYKLTTPSVDPRYLHIVLRHPFYQDRILSECTGASLERMRFHEDALKAFKVPVPPIDIQLTLIKKVSQIEEKVHNLTESIERERNQRNKDVLTNLGIMLEFSETNDYKYGLPVDDVKENPSLRLDFQFNRPSFKKIRKLEQGKYPLVEISNTKPNTQLLERKITSGSTPPGGIYPTKGVFFIQATNIDQNRLNMKEHEFITEEFNTSLTRSQLMGGEVLVTIAGTIGEAAVNELREANVNQAVAIIRPNERMNPLFLSAFLNSDGGKIQFAKHRHDFGTPNINQEELGRLKVPLPPRSTQDEIALTVKKHEDAITELTQSLSGYVRERSEYVTQFLIGEKTYEDIHQRLK